MITISSNARQIIATYQLRLAKSKDLTEPLTKAGALAVSAAKRRFTSEVGWAPNAPITIEIKGSSRPGIDTGKLRNSITADEATPVSIRVGTNLNYARWFQEGTGIYGPRGEPIRPVRAKALAFGGHFFKSVKGQPPRPFLYFDDPLRRQITQAFIRWLRQKPE
jgi:phage gpG-like protein